MSNNLNNHTIPASSKFVICKNDPTIDEVEIKNLTGSSWVNEIKLTNNLHEFHNVIHTNIRCAYTYIKIDSYLKYRIFEIDSVRWKGLISIMDYFINIIDMKSLKNIILYVIVFDKLTESYFDLIDIFKYENNTGVDYRKAKKFIKNCFKPLEKRIEKKILRQFTNKW